MKIIAPLAAILISTAPAAYAAAEKPRAAAPMLPGGNSKEPVSIEADKLVYFDKEQKAIYTGNVVVIQGDTKLTCSKMTIFMEREAPAAAAPAPAVKGAAAPAAPGGSSHVSHLDCAGPVTVLSKTQTATGDSATYDKPHNKVWLIGHVTLSDGGNVTKGDKLTYDLTSGEAVVDTGATGARVIGQFLPGSGADPAAPAKPKPKPAR
jgi:lipopolysaccharide export system protein LptA